MTKTNCAKEIINYIYKFNIEMNNYSEKNMRFLVDYLFLKIFHKQRNIIKIKY